MSLAGQGILEEWETWLLVFLEQGVVLRQPAKLWTMTGRRGLQCKSCVLHWQARVFLEAEKGVDGDDHGDIGREGTAGAMRQGGWRCCDGKWRDWH